ncbi:hypothetical protein Tco_0977564 [Tanacetum coccineum]|uniref:Reverse transcriptase domain-containing protein n=1 Tax=Tanacetum coccineum TaxID=301880 RepID=A0ABQ5EKN8_9ASTR
MNLTAAEKISLDNALVSPEARLTISKYNSISSYSGCPKAQSLLSQNMDEEDDDGVTKKLYKDVNMNLGNKDAEMTNVDQVTVIPEITSAFTLTIPPPPPFFNPPLLQQTTPTPTPTTSEATTSFPTLPDFSLIFKFNYRVTNLEKDLSELKQVDQYAQALSSIPAIVDYYIDNKLGEAINKAIQSHNAKCREEAQAKKQEYVDLVDTSMRTIIKEKSTYKAAASLSEFELTKILMDKMEKNKSYERADYRRELYDALMTKIKIKTPPLDQTEGRKEGSQARKSAHAEEPSYIVDDSRVQQNQELDIGHTDDQLDIETTPKLGPTFNLLKGTCKSCTELEYHFRECFKAVNDRLDWTNHEGHQYPFDLSKSLPLIEVQGHQVVPSNYFINNDLEYLKGGSLSRKYTTSTTKTRAAKYDNIEGIKDMVSTLWSLVKIAYDKYALWGILHWVQNDKDRSLKGRPDTSHVQGSIVIQKRVEDLQLGVKSYQKKLNITRPETFRSDIPNKTPYTTYNNPQGIIYLDKLKRNRLMHSDKLYKFCDGLLNSARTALHVIASNLRMNYLPKRRWSE